ncbi:restriction endonuclease subunit S [Alishewanella sp. HL-SH06]|uniref:restriction endonuclease subunit S n=1 Tax=Alishewanella sp. HL-SH06 TaxID=3461144 RepID=UPI0040416CF4
MGKYQAYPSYKDSCVIGLDKIPTEWSIRKIKYLFNIGRGRVISQEELVDEGEFPVYSSQTANDGCLGYISTYDFDCEQITWTTDGANAGTVFLRNGKHNCTNVCGTLQSKNGNQHLRFFLYCLQYVTQFYKRPDTNGAKIMNGEMAEIMVTEPLSEDKTTIANFLDHETAKIDTLIEKQQQLIQLLKEKRQAVISHAVTKGLNPNAPMKNSGVEWLGEVPEHWEGKSLNYLIAHTVDNRGRTPPVIEEGIPMCEVSQVAGNGLYTSNDFSKFISKESYDQFVRSDVEENDVLFVTVGATFGKTCLVPPTPDFFIAQNVVGFRCKTDVDPKYFMFLLSSDVFKEAISATNKSSTIDNVKVSDLVRTKLAVPPLIEQTEIANYIFAMVDKYEVLIGQAVLVINLLQERRTALISAAVTGKIDVRNFSTQLT